MIRICGSLVISCFKRAEYCADWLTGAAGPVFVSICWFLIVAGGLAFFDVLILHSPASWVRILFAPIAVLVAINLYAHYWLVTHVDPGDPRGIVDEWRREQRKQHNNGMTKQGQAVPRLRRCRKCGGPKPVRSHHCKVCKRCVLMMDHHCPWINQCVGLHNQRHFVLFMVYLTVACWSVVALGYDAFFLSLEMSDKWTAYTPSIFFTLLYILSIAIGIAVPILLSWHLYLVSRGETSIEGHDNDYFSKKAKDLGKMYVNPYDQGNRRENVELFFNVGRGRYPYTSLLWPSQIPPFSSGWRYPLHPAAMTAEEPAGMLVGGDEELTDDEEGGGGWFDVDT